MKELTITTPIIEATLDELSAEDRALVEEARRQTATSYAPYRRFHVGAAIRLDNGEIVAGSNQENAAFPSGLCAERTAAFYAHARYPEAKFETIAIAAVGTDGLELRDPIAPCGACRQSLLEYETLATHDVRVILTARDRVFILPSVRSTLPLAFSEF
ncbi:MAG: cytidine deaminase [Duncaniella sp.]|nr:cytidine deaminase [Duncaniella sp.]